MPHTLTDMSKWWTRSSCKLCEILVISPFQSDISDVPAGCDFGGFGGFFQCLWVVDWFIKVVHSCRVISSKLSRFYISYILHLQFRMFCLWSWVTFIERIEQQEAWRLYAELFLFLFCSLDVWMSFIIFIKVQLLWLLHSIGPLP